MDRRIAQAIIELAKQIKSLTFAGKKCTAFTDAE